MALLLVLLFAFECYQHATSSDPGGSDFAIYHRGAQRLAANPDTLYRQITKGQPEDWIYPPPAILLILPFLLLDIPSGFYVWMFLVYAALAASGLVWRALRQETGPPWKPVLLFVALAPGFHAAKNGQMDPMVLLLCLGYLFALERGRAHLAGACLACGVWIKIYPAILLLFALFHPRFRSVLASFLAVAVAIPVIALPFVPWRVEMSYFFEYLPAVARNTEPHIYNQSLIGMLTRQATGPFPAVFDSWAILAVHPAHKAAAAIVLLAAAAAAVWRIRQRGYRADVSDALLLLAVVPVASPLGWCHAYVYAIPAAAWCLWSPEGRTRIAGALAALLFCIPGYRVLPLSFLPAPVWNLANTRFLVAAILAAGGIAARRES